MLHAHGVGTTALVQRTETRARFPGHQVMRRFSSLIYAGGGIQANSGLRYFFRQDGRNNSPGCFVIRFDLQGRAAAESFDETPQSMGGTSHEP